MKVTLDNKNIYIVIITLLIFVIGFQWAYESNSFIDYNSGLDQDGGEYIRFVYIGSQRCGFSNNSENHENVIALREYIRNLAKDFEYKFISTGISVDINAYQGVNYLEKTGPFDEIVSGSTWFNIGADKYVWEEFQGRPATPQIILTKTEYMVEELSGINRSENVLIQVTGKDSIEGKLDSLLGLNNLEKKDWLENLF